MPDNVTCEAVYPTIAMTISRDVISAHFAELGMLKRPGPDVAAGHSEVCRMQKNMIDNSHDSTISEARGDLPSLDKPP